MRVIKAIFNFYIDASVHVALAVLSLVLLSYHYLYLPVDWNLGMVLFLLTIATYNFIKYGVEVRKYVLVSNRYHRLIQFFSIAALIPASYLASSFSMGIFVTLALLAILAALYAIPFLPQKQSLRTQGTIKVGIVALVWSGITVVLPVVAAKSTISFDFWIELFQRFLFVYALMIPFEIRDLRFDRPDLGTLPQILGIRATKYLGFICMFMAAGLTYFKDDIRPGEAGEKLLIFFILGVLIWFSNPERRSTYAAFWVEGLPIIWVVLVGISSL